ncbi:hypothetical protein EW026_g7723 [Hermanssonia centrifuga]|uniref:FAD/NAD(P)-binding domain-containing protein n=1 Tax=Hermanssonia centrifuga TaxID=98765 RepID=A0A4S4K8M4_9APHY|nr:hypothetical protein EW026_g7723 [Hermanssonia centrifuga]
MKSVLSLFAASAAVASAASTNPVCIVGAGPTGLTIANGLENKGHSTVIFEKNSEAGGKCQSYYDPSGQFHPMGALLFSNATFTETLKVVLQTNMTYYPFGYAGTAQDWLFDWRTGVVTPAPGSSAQLYPFIKADIDRYIAFWNQNIQPIWAEIGYKTSIPHEYTVPFAQWLLKNNYKAELVGLFETGMVPYGYGDVNETPAIYMFKYFTPDILLFFAGQHLGYLVDRSGNYPIITYTDTTTRSVTQKCSKIVLAFPPVMHALEAAHLDLSPEESAVFSPIGTTQYWSGAVNVATGNNAAFSAIAFEPAGQPSAFLPLFNSSSIASSWSWGQYRGSQTVDEAKQLLVSTISKFNKDPNNATALPRPITPEDVRDFKAWDYFPHYDTAQLNEGFYSKFNMLQGQKNTYYASGFNGFEMVEFAIRAGQDIVNTYFPKVI